MLNLFNQNTLTVFDKHAPCNPIIVKNRSYPWITDTKFMMKLRDEAALEYQKNLIKL